MPKSSGYDPRAVQALLQYAPRSGDPLAFIATALIESGLNPRATGDSGHSYGLFQLNDRGRLASYGLTSQQAYNPSINARVSADEFSKFAAKGLRGAQLALAAQRPSDPGYAAKFAAALPQAKAILGSGGSGYGALPSQPETGDFPKTALDVNRLMMLLRNQRGRSLRGIMPAKNFRKELTKLVQAAGASSAVGAAQQNLGQGLGQVAQGMGNYAGDLASIPAHNVQFSAAPNYDWANSLAKQFGLTVSSTYRDPSKNASVGGSKTSRHMVKGGAADFSGTPEQMRALADAAIRSGQFAEVFYDPLGFYWDNGRINRGGIGGHSDHVHISFGRRA